MNRGHCESGCLELVVCIGLDLDVDPGVSPGGGQSKGLKASTRKIPEEALDKEDELYRQSASAKAIKACWIFGALKAVATVFLLVST